MMHQTKIATCCYCGSRQTLRLTARDGHELACGSCGAPLHEMKWLKVGGRDGVVKRSPRHPAPHGGDLPRDWTGRRDARAPVRRKPSRKRRKGFLREMMEEAFDLIEDIID
jgi:hypothetical protein